MIPSSRPRLSDLYTLLENHTLHSSTYLYGPYKAVSPNPPPPSPPLLNSMRCTHEHLRWMSSCKSAFSLGSSRVANFLTRGALMLCACESLAITFFLTPDTYIGEPQPYLFNLGRSFNYQKIEKAIIRKIN